METERKRELFLSLPLRPRRRCHRSGRETSKGEQAPRDSNTPPSLIPPSSPLCASSQRQEDEEKKRRETPENEGGMKVKQHLDVYQHQQFLQRNQFKMVSLLFLLQLLLCLNNRLIGWKTQATANQKRELLTHRAGSRFKL